MFDFDKFKCDNINVAFFVCLFVCFGFCFAPDCTTRLYPQELYGVDALPFKPRMVVHWRKNYGNARAILDMFFGDGLRWFYPLVCLDVVAHELGHIFTRLNSKVLYQ